MIIGQRKKQTPHNQLAQFPVKICICLYFVSTVSMSVGNLNRYILFTHPQYNIASILLRGRMYCIVHAQNFSG